MALPLPVAVPMDVPPYRLSGTVYGTLLNHRSALAALSRCSLIASILSCWPAGADLRSSASPSVAAAISCTGPSCR